MEMCPQFRLMPTERAFPSDGSPLNLNEDSRVLHHCTAGEFHPLKMIYSTNVLIIHK